MAKPNYDKIEIVLENQRSRNNEQLTRYAQFESVDDNWTYDELVLLNQYIIDILLLIFYVIDFY